MHKLRKYIIDNFSSLFLSIFLPLFSIALVVFLIKLATYTAVIQLSIWEMAKLYFFILPEVLFYTLPVTFFIAATLTIFRLSNENEIVVLFALGIKPSFILQTLLRPALLLSAILAFDFFILFPHATVLSSNFVSYKKSEAKFNLSAGEFGHKFGDWLLYLGKANEDGTYSDVFLFNKQEENEEILIAAKEAKIINDSGILRLELSNGQGYSYSQEKFTQINFKQMHINDTMSTDLTQYKKPLDYWRSNDRAESKRHMLITDILLSLFPLMSLFLIAAISIVHARHHKSRIYIYLFLGILGFYGSTLGLQGVLSYYTIPVVIIAWMSITYYIYTQTIVKRF